MIGLTLFSSRYWKKNKALLGREAARLEQETDLLIALCHLNSKTGLALVTLCQVDVFVSGHAHEVLAQPSSQEVGARIVQAVRWHATSDAGS